MTTVPAHQRQAATPGNTIFFGWKVVAASFLIAVFAWGLGFYGPSIYVNELVRTRGWPVAAVSGAVTFHFLFSAALVIGLADAQSRLGIVAVTRLGVIAFGLGVIGWAFAAEIWQLYLAAALTGVGWACLSGAAINSSGSRPSARSRFRTPTTAPASAAWCLRPCGRH
jgi:MFS family permease